jgi:hypothetical protein
MTVIGKRASATGAESARWPSPMDSPTNQPKEKTRMCMRFISWVAMAIAAAFLVVATAAFALSAVKWLAFGIGIGTLLVSIGVCVRYRRHLPTVIPAALSERVVHSLEVGQAQRESDYARS